MSSARTRIAGALALGVALSGASTGVASAAPAVAASPATRADTSQTLNLININDFHGRIASDLTTRWATTIERLRAGGGENNTLLLSAGDNIGASLFASSSAQDNPTIDVLNALDLDGSSVGNHEFDKGYSDLTDRVQGRANWIYTGANVYKKGTTTPALPAYQTFNVDGTVVGVIGAVTQETPTLVSPDGVSNLTFGDPVDAVNRVADDLTDGSLSNGEADVILAEYHEGAPNGDAENATLVKNLSDSPVFSKIVNQTSPKVAAIFTGHTHKRYAYAAPVPGSATATRPVIESGSYGDFVGHVTLTLDTTTGEVTGHTEENVAKAAAEDLSFPRVAEVKRITDNALAAAAKLGNQPIAQQTADITTAFTGGSYVDGVYTGGTRDDRGSESTLGDLVANALRNGVSDIASPDLGITNPGGLRADLLFAGNTSSNPANTDGVITYAEANSVLPFNNTVALVKLTGAQIKTILEQQYQTTTDGTTPSRAYLQLGLSDNVRVTTDPTKDAGSRITSVYLGDQPLDPAKTYTVSTVNFLAAGGDNFRGFTAGTVTDTQRIDAQVFRDYLAAKSPLSPDFARQQVTESGKPDSVKSGDDVSFVLSNLDLTSQGSPANTSVKGTIMAGGKAYDVGTFPVADGTSTIAFTVPAGITSNGTLSLVANPSKTTVSIPVTGTKAGGGGGTGPTTPINTTIDVRQHPKRVKAGKTRPRIVVKVNSAASDPVRGLVKIAVPGKGVYKLTLSNGKAKFYLPVFHVANTRTIKVVYRGTKMFHRRYVGYGFRVFNR